MEDKLIKHFVKEYSRWRNQNRLNNTTVGGKKTPKTIQEFFKKLGEKNNKK